MESDQAATLALLMATGNAFVAINRLTATVRRAGLSLATLCEMPPLDRLRCLPPGDGLIASALARVSKADLTAARLLLDRAQTRNIWALTRADAAYPLCLTLHLNDAAPPMLFGRGDRRILTEPMAAIVGTRNPTAAGIQAAESCAAWMVAQQITLVSGGARGVDSAAHEEVLRQGGRTIVTLPQGLFTYTPPESFSAALNTQDVILLSAFPLDAEWATHAALMRNAIISAFARFVCVIEPYKEGGSIRSARCALGQAKPVLVASAQHDAGAFAHLLCAGALPLLTADGAVDTSALSLAWRQDSSERPRQPDLFG